MAGPTGWAGKARYVLTFTKAHLSTLVIDDVTADLFSYFQV